MSAPVTVTYYLEILSSWCHYAEPTWAQLKAHYAGRVDFQWKIALMNPDDFPVSTEQCDWFYRRSGLIVRTPYKLDSGWFEVERKGNYPAPDLVAEAGRDFLDPTDDRLRIALAHAALRQGEKIGKLATAIEVASRTFSIDASKLRAAAESPGVRARVDASTADFHAHRITQRPAFILESEIGDKAVFSGFTRYEPLAATLEAMLADAAAYAAHAAHFGKPVAQ